MQLGVFTEDHDLGDGIAQAGDAPSQMALDDRSHPEPPHDPTRGGPWRMVLHAHSSRKQAPNPCRGGSGGLDLKLHTEPEKKWGRGQLFFF